MLKRRIRSVLILLAAALPVAAQTSNYDLPIREHVFDNGLRLLVLERPGDHRVACKIFTDFGAMVEKPGDLGSAHFIEHLMFKGTETLGTIDWPAEKEIIAQIYDTEKALINALNRARNATRQRGVFHDYEHAVSTAEIDSLHLELARLDSTAAQYRKNGEMMTWYQGYGGTHLSATTEQEYMKFDINLPANRVALFLRVEADRMRNSVFREFDQERMILLEQRYGDLNRPTTPYHEAMNALVQTVHPVYWPEGYLSDFSQYTRHGTRDMYSNYFVPNNTSLIFVGGVTLEQMIPLVRSYFGWMQRAPEPERVRAIEPVPQAEKRMIYRSDDLRPRVELRFGMPGIGHPERPGFDVLGPVLDKSISDAMRAARISGSANINMRVVHTSRFGVPSSFNIEWVLENESDLALSEQILQDVIRHLKVELVSSDVLQTAKKKLRSEWYRTALSADQLAFEIGHFQVMDHWTTLKKHLDAREHTTAADLRHIAQRYFVAQNLSVGIVKSPEDEDRKGGAE